jgi:hypothetical protein
MSHPLFESLQNSSSPREFISSIKKIINKNDPSLRVKEIIPIILGKKQLIIDNRTLQQQLMIQTVGEMFLWLMPHDPDLPEEEEKIQEELRAAAYEFCATPEVEAFFLEAMLSSAFDEQAIITTARAVCSLARFGNKRKLFTCSFAATEQILKMAARAPTQEALERSFGAMVNITSKTDDDSVRQGYLTEKNFNFLLETFQRLEDGKCLEAVAQVLLNISFCKVGVRQISTPEFRAAVLDKLSVSRWCGVVARLCGYIANVSAACAESARFFKNEKTAKILIHAVQLAANDMGSFFGHESPLDFFFEIDRLWTRVAAGNLSAKIALEPLNFAMKEFCAAIFRCFDFATTDGSRGSCAGAISTLARNCDSVCRILANIPSIAEKLHEAIKNTEHPYAACYIFDAIGNICFDKECTRPFANLKTLQLLVDSRKKVTDEEILKLIDRAMRKIIFQFPEFLDFCAAQFDTMSEYHERLMKEVTTLEELATFSRANVVRFFLSEKSPIIKRCSFLIICEKLDQFILSRKEENENNQEFQKNLLRIGEALGASTNKLWEETLNHRILDTFVFSLLQHGTGKTSRRASLLILWRIRRPNSPALSSAILKVILEKMDEADDKTCFEWDMNGECFFSVGLQLLRHAVSENSKDLSKRFFDHNLNLINRVFKKGYDLGGRDIREAIDEAIGEFRSFIPRMTHAPQIFMEKESGQRRDRDGNPSAME